MRGILKVAAVKAPDFGDRRLHILEDIATLTGGQVVSVDKGMRLDKFNTDWFGSARVVTVGKESTTIVDGKGDGDIIESRILELKNQIDLSKSPYEVEKLQERLAKMVGGVAIINVGGGTEIEMKEKKDRLDDALQATKAALEEGILPGAGVALLNARNAITNRDNTDFGIGSKIVFNACSVPFEQILGNAGKRFVNEKHVPYLPPEEPLGPNNLTKVLNNIWTACWDNEAGAIYYYNNESGEATWVPPEI
jgi:chaperonin GroEL